MKIRPNDALVTWEIGVAASAAAVWFTTGNPGIAGCAFVIMNLLLSILLFLEKIYKLMSEKTQAET